MLTSENCIFPGYLAYEAQIYADQEKKAGIAHHPLTRTRLLSNA